jgi:MoxR-like ATPase
VTDAGRCGPFGEKALQTTPRQMVGSGALAVAPTDRCVAVENERAAIINGERGCGKTTIGIATAAVLHAEGYRRTLILSPSHLVYKWRREIQKCGRNWDAFDKRIAEVKLPATAKVVASRASVFDWCARPSS